MRKIKYRAWQKDSKSMYEVSGIQDYKDGSVRVFSNQAQIGGRLSDRFKKIKDKWNIELMQSTGLFDKNGKEIYEGDYITTDEGYDEPDILNRIVWNEDKAAFVIEAWMGDNEWDDSVNDEIYWQSRDKKNRLKDFEVRGNIYENSNIIKDQELVK